MALGLLATPRDAAAQLDPLLFLKKTKPNVILAIDTSTRMRLDAVGTYYDPAEYSVQNTPWEPVIGVTNAMTKYRRTFNGWVNTSALPGVPTFTSTNIGVVGNNDPKYAYYAARTRLSLIRAAATQAINENSGVARFGLLKIRQSNPTVPNASNATIVNGNLAQTPTENIAGTWGSTVATVTAENGTTGSQPPVILADAAGANSSIVALLSKNVTDAGALVPAGYDTALKVDAPLDNLVHDAKSEAARLIALDTECRNTVVVLVVGGGEGLGSAKNPAVTAAQMLNVGGRRVPVYVVAIAPAAGDVAQLNAIATNSGGQYFEITEAMIDAAYNSWFAGVPSGYLAGQPSGTVVVPEIVKAINAAVQHSFQEFAIFNTAPSAGDQTPCRDPGGAHSRYRL